MAKSHKDWLTDEQVEKEIERLKQTPEVKLAKKDEQIRYRRRQYLYCLRQYEKKGKALMDAGITMEMLEKMDNESEDQKMKGYKGFEKGLVCRGKQYA